jgi:hypothetical protein
VSVAVGKGDGIVAGGGVLVAGVGKGDGGVAGGGVSVAGVGKGDGVVVDGGVSVAVAGGGVTTGGGSVAVTLVIVAPRPESALPVGSTGTVVKTSRSDSAVKDLGSPTKLGSTTCSVAMGVNP